MNRHHRLIRQISIALAYDRAGGIHAMQAGLLNAMESWARADADAEAVGPAVDAVLTALVRLEVALDGGSAAERAEAAGQVPNTVAFMGELHKVCSAECAYLYQERCPDRSHVTEDESEKGADQ
jgi:hypothetical protein